MTTTPNMASTKRRNPAWNREETILALNLFFESGLEVPLASSPEVKQLSDTLKRNPTWDDRDTDERFRSPGSVVFKISNLAAASGRSGFENNSKLDREIWGELGDQPELVTEFAKRIEHEIGEALGTPPIFNEDETVFIEGELVTSRHKARERSPKLRKLVLKCRKRPLACDACGTLALGVPESAREAVFEVHHLKPLHLSGAAQVRTSDCALLCANCHRAVHAIILSSGKWLSLQEVRDAISSEHSHI